MSPTPLFMVWLTSDIPPRLNNGWFSGPVDLVRWLKLYAGPLNVVGRITLIRED